MAAPFTAVGVAATIMRHALLRHGLLAGMAIAARDRRGLRHRHLARAAR